MEEYSVRVAGIAGAGNITNRRWSELLSKAVADCGNNPLFVCAQPVVPKFGSHP